MELCFKRRWYCINICTDLSVRPSLPFEFPPQYRPRWKISLALENEMRTNQSPDGGWCNLIHSYRWNSIGARSPPGRECEDESVRSIWGSVERNNDRGTTGENRHILSRCSGWMRRKQNKQLKHKTKTSFSLGRNNLSSAPAIESIYTLSYAYAMHQSGSAMINVIKNMDSDLNTDAGYRRVRLSEDLLCNSDYVSCWAEF